MKKNKNLILKWFFEKSWKLLPFQKEAWEKIQEGKSGLICVPTGAGKTYAAYLPALSRLCEFGGEGLRILYITPLKSLAKDLEISLKKPIDDLMLPYRIEKRTGDSSASIKRRQKKSLPDILLTTPESLSLLLSDKQAALHFSNVQMIIVDEWHELLGTKRGVLLELCVARIKKWSHIVQIWGLTATIGNPQQAAKACVGIDRFAELVTSEMQRELIIDTILPETIQKLPWIGYLGIKMLPYVVQKLDLQSPTLLFTNTRSQAEKWFQGIIEAKPEWKNFVALHHSSIDKESRRVIEEKIKSAELKFVVCTSALDLGIDFPLVEKVIQIGSPKSIARLIQRAGRASHRPLTPCHISLVPTHALQVLDMKAYKMAVKKNVVENRLPLKKCYDVLLQHIMTCAIGGGIEKKAFYKEITTTECFSELSFEEYESCLHFLTNGGKAFTAYSEYKKLVERDAFFTVEDPQIVRRHKMSIGTISADSYVVVKLLKGKSLGTIEESFVAQLKPGDNFIFAGKCVKLVSYRDLTAHVRLTKDRNAQAAVWSGMSLPFSSCLGNFLREALNEQDFYCENALLKEITILQKAKSHLPNPKELLIEIVKSREGWHIFFFPFEGKTIHEGLGLLIAHRLSKAIASTLVISCNDYGFEILSKTPFDETMLNSELFEPKRCYEEFKELINRQEISKSAFREIAKISGLVFQGILGKAKSTRQLQMSASLLFQVLENYDPENLLLLQAKKQTIDKYFADDQLTQVLQRLQSSSLIIKHLVRFSPFSLPLFIERVSQRISTESLAKRIAMIQGSWVKKS